MTTPTEHTLKLKRNRPLSNARPAQSNAARATATAHDDLDRYLRAVNYLAAAIKQLLWERPENERFDVNGYRGEGTTTTPFDMQVRNKISRWHLVILTAQKLAARNPRRTALAEELIRKYELKLREHYAYVRATSIDPPEILNWCWKARRPNSARTMQKL